MIASIQHISVCICTYKRPELLALSLSKLETQETENLFNYSIFVVDNDSMQSARQTVKSFSERSKITIEYLVETEKNIALARNKAVKNSKGSFIAFIDDDEFPQKDWLIRLYKAILKFGADGVLGPVKPFFTVEAPKWILKGRFCERESFKTGTILHKAKHTRTGNVLFRKEVFEEGCTLFNPIFGKTGGEDVDFFERVMQRGRIFVWCDEGAVFEVVPEERLTRAYFVKRALLRGVANARKTRKMDFDVIKSAGAFMIYSMLLPILIFARHDIFMKYLTKDCDHIGKLLAICGVRLVKERGF